jgi:hypothetical protein
MLDDELRHLVKASDIRLISFRPLRDLQRADVSAGGTVVAVRRQTPQHLTQPHDFDVVGFGPIAAFAAGPQTGHRCPGYWATSIWPAISARFRTSAGTLLGVSYAARGVVRTAIVACIQDRRLRTGIVQAAPMASSLIERYGGPASGWRGLHFTLGPRERRGPLGLLQERV